MKQLVPKGKSISAKKLKKMGAVLSNAEVASEEEIKKDEDIDDVDQKDDGCIGVVLRVLARMCDGQHIGLQVNK